MSAARSTRPRALAGDRIDGVAAGRGGRRVGAVRRFRHQDAPARVAARCRARRGSPSCRTIRHARRPPATSATAGMPVRVFSQCARVSISSSAPWHGRGRLQRMEVGETGQPRQLLVEARVVLHRARAERVEPAVDRVVLLRQPGEMAHHLRLAEARQADRVLPFEPAEPGAKPPAGSGRSTPQRPGYVLLEQQRLLDLQPAVAAERRARFRCSRCGGCTLSAWLQSLIDSTSRRPASSRFDVVLGHGLGRGDQQQIGELRPLGIEAG